MTVSFPPRSGQAQRPEMFKQWSERFPTTDGGITSAVKLLVDGYTAYCVQHQRTAADETATPAARLVKNAKLARTKLIPLVEQLDVASNNAALRARDLAEKTSHAYNPPDPRYPDVVRRQEIRAHFKALPNTERLKLLSAAMETGDEDTMVAVASCQPYLSGVVPQMHQHVRDQLIEKHAPNEAATMKAIGEQRMLAEQLRAQVLQSVSAMVDFQKADELIAAAHEEMAA